jgi:hypothetical protein
MWRARSAFKQLVLQKQKPASAAPEFELLGEPEDELREEALELAPFFPRIPFFSWRGIPATGDCSGWERDPQSFSVAVAKHLIRQELGKELTVKRMSQGSSTAWRVVFPDNIVVLVSLSRVPDFVFAARWEPKPAAPTRFYTYSCTPNGQLVLRERAPP